MNEQSKLDDEAAARLLSGRNSPSVLQKDALFEQIYRRVTSQSVATRWQWKRVSFVAAAALSVAATVLLWPTASPEFAARGGPLVNEPAFRVLCLGRGEASCRQGGTLAFEIAPRAQAHYFAAFARRTDGVIVWYFPTVDGLSTLLAQQESPLVLDHAVELGSEQPPGRYEIFGVFSDGPLSRAAIKTALGDDLSGSQGVVVKRRSFEVLP